jgi:phosphatidylserine/phosphatidylglycerophosphate/cardiolipin synthase-like enzyme
MPTEFISDKAIYDRVIQEMVIEADRYVWIATADIKDLYVKRGSKMVPFLGVLSDMIENGISVRLLHAKEPGPNFRKDFDRFPPLIEGLERMLCPRVHFKSVIVDGKRAYTGSANLTGAGMGAKSENRRNFESGILTSDPVMVKTL